MKVMINNLIEELENLNKKNNIENKEQILEKAFIEIQFFQHERLIHLMVTFFVGIAAIIILGFSIVTEILGMYLLFLVLFILFIPYIFYYHYLENHIQYLYQLYLEVKEK